MLVWVVSPIFLAYIGACVQRGQSMPLQADRVNPREVAPDSSGAYVVVADPAAAPISPDWDWSKQYVTQAFFKQLEKMKLLLSIYIQKAYNLPDNHFNLETEHLTSGFDSNDHESQEYKKISEESLFQNRKVSPHQMGGAVQLEMQYAWAIAKFLRFEPDGTITEFKREFEEEFLVFEEIGLKELQLLRYDIDLQIREKYAAVKAGTENSNRLFRNLRLRFMFDWVIARKSQETAPDSIAVESQLQHTAVPALHLPEMAERMRELQRTPVLYDAWLRETRRDTASSSGPV